MSDFVQPIAQSNYELVPLPGAFITDGRFVRFEDDKNITDTVKDFDGKIESATEAAEEASDKADALDARVTALENKPSGDDYAPLKNKPKINGVELSGNKTAEDLGLGTYSKPSGGIPKTDLAEAVQQEISEKIDAPQTATVGQVLAVKAVDASGKPTEWETVEKGGGGVKLPNLVDKVWLPCKPIPYQTGKYSTLISYKDELHVLGSSNSSCYTNHYKWNGNEWISVSTLPYQAYKSGVVVYNDEIHLLGGDYSSNTKYYHYKWDGKKWTAVSNLPIPFYEGNVVVHKGEIYLIGTSDSSYSTYCYKWNGTIWSRIASIPGGANSSSAAISYKNELYVFGARGGYDDCKYIEKSNTWNVLPTYSGMGNYAIVVSDDKIHGIGGSSQSLRQGRHYVYDSEKWTAYPDTSFFAYGKHNCVEYDSQIYYTTDNSSNEGAVYVYTDIK